MNEFTSKMRETLIIKMPGLTSSVASPPGEMDHLADLLDDMAKEPEELEPERERRYV